MSIIQEFKTFAVKGNAFDLAVGVVIGAAFGKIVTSLVNDIINPFITFLIGGINFSDKVFTLPMPFGDTTEIIIKYGDFITNVINFLIVAFFIFFLVKQMNKFKHKEEATNVVKAPKISDEVKVLTEIKDLLSKKIE